MFNKNVALAALLFCSPIFTLIGDHDHHETKEESKINAQKLEILQKKLEDIADTEKKLILSKGYTSHEDIGFYLTLACAAGAGAAFAFPGKSGVNDKSIVNTKILAPSLIVGAVGAGLWFASSYKQQRILRNLTEETKETLHAISDVKQH